MNGGGPGLIADIGGTNARFALVFPGQEASRVQVMKCADYPGPAEAAMAYFERLEPHLRPKRGAFSVASALTSDIVDITNNPWTFSIEAVRLRLGLDALRVVNDFTAVAMCVPYLTKPHRTRIGEGQELLGQPCAVLGPGTGLGVSAVIPTETQWVALATEGGHVTLPAVTEREARVIEVLRAQYGHVSAERCISGPGLVNLYRALCSLENRQAEALTPGMISERALEQSDAICAEALEMFFAMFGTVAGNLALSLGARGGVFIAGGIVPQLMTAFKASPFRQRFLDKGRFDGYVAQIPTFVITHPYPAFLGLAALIREPVEVKSF